MVTAAATMSLTGPFALQGRQAARGLRWWAADADIALEVRDDGGSASVAVAAYQRWLNGGVDILLGPYSSGLVRSVVSSLTGTGVVLWNHGGSADDLARPLLVTLPAAASTYFRGAVLLAAHMGLEELLLVAGSGRFAAAVARGARATATRIGLPVTEIGLVEAASVAGTMTRRAAVFLVGTFEQDIDLVTHLQSCEAGLIACVAAGLPEFGERLGPAAEQVVGPVQWIPEAARPDLGPSGIEYTRYYQATYGNPPTYVAAQATAAGLLAGEARRLGLTPNELQRWRTSTLLGSFALDQSWRQIGHTTRTVRWRDGRQEPVP